MPGRPRTPTNILKLRGADKNHPERFKERENEPVNTNPIGKPPSYLDRKEKAVFRWIVKESVAGVLGEADRMAVSIASRLMHGFMESKLTGTELTQLNKLLGQFGMLSADRSKISLPGQEKKNRFDDDELPKAGKRKLIPGTRILIQPEKTNKFDDF